MNFIRNNMMTILLAVVVGAVAVGAYYYFGGNASSSAPLTSAPAVAGPSSQELLSDLNDLKTVTFDTTLFSDPAFMSLMDFNVDIPPQPIGNQNPFAPLK